jgi:hypothetical protein
MRKLAMPVSVVCLGGVCFARERSIQVVDVCVGREQTLWTHDAGLVDEHFWRAHTHIPLMSTRQMAQAVYFA